MKKQINPTIKAYLIRGAFYLLLLLAVCAIPFALAQSRSRGTAMGTVARSAVHPNLTSLGRAVPENYAVPANPDFAPPGVIQGQLASLRTDGAVALASGATNASGAAVVNKLGAPLFPEGGCGTPGPWQTATPGRRPPTSSATATSIRSRPEPLMRRSICASRGPAIMCGCFPR